MSTGKKVLSIALRIFLVFILSGIVTGIFGAMGIMEEVFTYTGNLFVCIAVFLAYYLLRDQKRYSLRFKDRKVFRNFALGIGFGVLSIAIIFLLNLAFGRIRILKIENILFTQDFYRSLLVMLGVGIGEEVFSRGYLQNMTTHFSNDIVGIAVPSLLFTVLHFFNPGAMDNFLPTINLLLISIVFALLCLYFKSLWVAIGYHFSWNFFQGNIFGMNVSGMDRQTSLFSIKVIERDIVYGGTFGPEGGILVTALLVLSIGLLISYHRKQSIEVRQEAAE